MKSARAFDRSCRTFDDGGVLEHELPYFQDANARVQELTGLALSVYGWPLSP